MARQASRRRSGVRRTRVGSQTTLSVNVGQGASGDRLGQAAEKIAEGVREVSATFSVKIPPSVHVRQGSETSATVYADAPNAYPIETGARHPLFGNREHWYRMKQRLFLEQGAAVSLDQAAEVYGKTIDDWLREVGW